MIPRAEIDEVITRWDLSSLPLILVEGPYDQRVLDVAKGEPWYPKEILDIDIWTIDAINIPSALTQDHGLTGTGAKQRVIGFVREVEKRNVKQGFRGVVDRDLDHFIGDDHSSEALLYTDFSCTECYFWTDEVLRKILILFKCEQEFDTPAKISDLRESITDCCKILTAIRVVAHEIPNAIEFSNSDRSFNLLNGRMQVQIERFLAQSKLKGAYREEFEKRLNELLGEIKVDSIFCVNGHDLVRLLTFALKEKTRGTARFIDEEPVANAVVCNGLTLCSLVRTKLFQQLSSWKNDIDKLAP